MSEEQPPGDSGWVVEPGVEIRLAVGDQAQLTPEMRSAIDDLIRALEAETSEAEVEAFGRKCPIQCKPPGYGICNPEESCQPKVWMPCARKEICSIAELA